jgi:hypothetical protein
MLQWLFVAGDYPHDLERRLAKAFCGSALVSVLRLTAKARPCTVIEPEAATVLRKPRWPDVLTDWTEIYEEPLFPSPLLPVAAEVLSETGAESLALFADLGHPSGARGGVAWYQKGGLVELEQVGSAAVAWQKGQPLSRPRVHDARAQLAALGRSRADNDRDAGLYDRVESSRAVTAEAILARALLRLTATDPPPISELAEVLARGGRARLRLG